MPIITGSFLRHLSKVELSTADNKQYTLNMNPLHKLAFGIIGLPHLGFRMRARIILKEAFTFSKETHILDAGCGYGLYTATLAQNGYAVDGIDLDENRVGSVQQMVQELPGTADKVTLHVGTLTNTRLPSLYYDLAICSDVIEHIADDNSAVKEVARSLKTGGSLILSVPHFSKHNEKIFKKFGHERPGYTKESLNLLFKSHNLSIQKTFYFEYWLGSHIFEFYNSLKSKPLMGILFYPCYALYMFDFYLAKGEANGIVVVAKKN